MRTNVSGTTAEHSSDMENVWQSDKVNIEINGKPPPPSLGETRKFPSMQQ